MIRFWTNLNWCSKINNNYKLRTVKVLFLAMFWIACTLTIIRMNFDNNNLIYQIDWSNGRWWQWWFAGYFFCRTFLEDKNKLLMFITTLYIIYIQVKLYFGVIQCSEGLALEAAVVVVTWNSRDPVGFWKNQIYTFT